MEVRIIGGNYPNFAVQFKNKNIRPSLSRTRICIFDTIKTRVQEKYTLLDCFAGSGVIGLEALSRGCLSATFFDKESEIIKQIQNNLDKMPNITGISNLLVCNTLFPPKGKPMDIIFLDPPYSQIIFLHKYIKKLYNQNWINENTLIIIESYYKYKIPYEHFKHNIIGSSQLHFLYFYPEMLDLKVIVSKSHKLKQKLLSNPNIRNEDFLYYDY